MAQEKGLRDEIKKALTGDLQKDALEFLDYLESDELALDSVGEPICSMLIHPIQNQPYWNLYIGGYPSLVYKTERQDLQIDNDLKEFVWSTVKVCAYFKTNGENCGCGQQPGYTLMIFGKKFNNCCQCPIWFGNPDAETAIKIKRLIEAWKLCVAELKK